MSELKQKILELHHLKSIKIAQTLGCSPRYARRVLREAGLNHPPGPPSGEANQAWVGGRMVCLDGYVLLQTKPTRISEHRVVMERELGRSLLPEEVVDHIDGITIHNAPSNLRLFASNAEHLKVTTSGKAKQISKSGRKILRERQRRVAEGHKALPTVDTYRLRKKRGDVRLRAILRAALELGTEHPCLSGTRHWLEQSGIDPHCRHSLERAWDDLLLRWEADLLQ